MPGGLGGDCSGDHAAPSPPPGRWKSPHPVQGPLEAVAGQRGAGHWGGAAATVAGTQTASWRGPGHPPEATLSSPCPEMPGLRRTGHTTFLHPGMRRIALWLVPRSPHLDCCIDRASRRGKGGPKRGRPQGPSLMSTPGSRVHHLVVSTEARARTGVRSLEPGPRPPQARRWDWGSGCRAPRGWTPSPTPLLWLGVPDGLTRMGALTLGTWTGAGPVAARGWSGAGMFALTICQKGGCPWPLLGGPSPCPGAQAQLSPQLQAAGEEEGPSGPLGNSRSSRNTKGSFLRLACPLASSWPLLCPALGDPSPNSYGADSSPAQRSRPSGLPSPAQRLCKSLWLLN